MENYQHPPLPGDRFIRVMNLLPSRAGELHCKLLPVSLDKLPKFEALSYSWGPPILSSTIFCDGKPWGITPNCEAALRRLRQPQKSRLVWVDAICINQNSIPECNNQVKYMGEIYGQAKQVVVWLGESTPQTEIAFKYFKKFYDIGLTGNAFGESVRSRAIDREMERLKDECQKYSTPNIPVLDSVLLDIFSRDWFSRVWTVQEVALSRSTTMLCGTSEISFPIFVSGSRNISVVENRPWSENPLLGQGVLGGAVALHSRMMTTLQKHPNVRSKVLSKIGILVSRGPKPTVLKRSTILQLIHDKKATKPIDKIYGIYSLFSALNIPLVGEIDYAKSIENVYFQETVRAITEDQSLDVLYCLTGATNPDLPNLPSWVPDWSDTSSPRCPNYRFYAACGPSAPVAKLSPNGLRLTCYCRIIGVINGIAEKTMPRLGAIENFRFENILPTVQNWATFCEPGFTQGVTVSEKPKKYYSREYFRLSNFCDILVRGCAPYFDPYGEVDIPHNIVNNPDEGHKKELDRMGMVWAPIATSLTTDILYQRLTGYPESIVSDDIMTGIAKALEGTPSARKYHRLVEVMSEGLVMFKTQTGFVGTALPSIKEKDEVALIAGLRMPFVVRPGATGTDPYRIICPAYVQDTMAAEYWWDEPSPESFTLVLG